jgi:hypothetical protein
VLPAMTLPLVGEVTWTETTPALTVLVLVVEPPQAASAAARASAKPPESALRTDALLFTPIGCGESTTTLVCLRGGVGRGSATRTPWLTNIG